MNLRALGDIPNVGREDTSIRAIPWLSLVPPTIDDGLALLAAQALDAQSKLSRDVSLPLAVEQWKVEAQQLFESSLAQTNYRS